MTHEEALAYWFRHVNYEQSVPRRADLELDRMRALLARLGDPHRRLRILHIAGSKGKGSTSAMLAAILRQAGYRTGLFTSPHLISLSERFQVNGQPIQTGELTQLLTEIRTAAESMTAGPPTFFEIATAVGFLHFVRRRCDAVVLEVGLGGRLDSTNVCTPVLSVITSISYDHTRILGDRLSSIAREKAGIIKPGLPVVSGVTGEEARPVIEAIAKERRAALVELGRDVHFVYHPGRVEEAGIRRPVVEVTTARRRWPALEVNLLGEHQAANAAVVVACVEELRRQGWHLTDRSVAQGLASVDWPARLEVVGRQPWILLDCAHNIASAEALVRTLETSFPPARRILVFAGSSDKDVAGMFRVLAPYFPVAILTRYTSNLRAIPAEQLAEIWIQAGGQGGRVSAAPGEALEMARRLAGEKDLIVITGSVFLAGEMRALVHPSTATPPRTPPP